MVRLLYIEDDPGLARLVQKRLVRQGYEVDLAVDGRDGISMLQAGSYDLLLIDYMLPLKNGLEIIRELKDQEMLPPFVMVTGGGNEQVAVEVMKLGLADYIVKDTEGRYLELLPSFIERLLARQLLYREKEQAELALQKANAALEQMVSDKTKKLKQTHEQLLHAEKLGAVGRLSASIAHEFNNPLCGIMNVISGIKNRANLSETDDELAALALNECSRIKALIQNLQSFNRPSSGKRGQFDIHQALDQMLVFAKKELKLKKVRVTKQYSPAVPLIWGVEDQIKQVFVNLLNNACDAMPPEGGEVAISTCVTDGFIALSISDTGGGISPESMGEIFEPFFTSKPAVKGTGLGLSVSYGIIKSHGGDISVKSSEGKGSTFTITLPAERRRLHEEENSGG